MFLFCELGPLIYGTDSNCHGHFPIAMYFLKKQMYVMHLFIPTNERKKYIKTFKNQKSLGDDFPLYPAI